MSAIKKPSVKSLALPHGRALLWVSLGLLLAGGGFPLLLGIAPLLLLQKYLLALAMPVGLVWLLILGVMGEALRRRQKTVALLGLLLWLVYTLAGNGTVASFLVRSLEAPYVTTDPFQTDEAFDAVILLGGDSREGANRRCQGGDRLVLAAQLYHAGLAEEVICTGASLPRPGRPRKNPAETAAAVLKGLGLPPEVITQIGGRNTSEEMKLLGQRFGADPSARVGLLTSAWHLPRACRLAARQGLHPVPIPADFLTGPAVPSLRGFSLLPSADALRVTSLAFKEYLARVVGR